MTEATEEKAAESETAADENIGLLAPAHPQPDGTVFIFEVAKGQVDPRSQEPAKKDVAFRLRLFEATSEQLKLTHPDGQALALNYEQWNTGYAPAVVELRWPEGKEVADSDEPETESRQPTAESSEDEDWRDEKLSDLHDPAIKPKILEAMTEAGIETIGHLVDRQEAEGDWWHKKVKGVGVAAKDNIADAMETFWGRWNMRAVRERALDDSDGPEADSRQPNVERPATDPTASNREMRMAKRLASIAGAHADVIEAGQEMDSIKGDLKDATTRYKNAVATLVAITGEDPNQGKLAFAEDDAEVL